MPSNIPTGTSRRFDSSDEGKQVLTADGDVLGMVERVELGTAYVKPNPGLLKGSGSVIIGPWNPSEPLRLDDRHVETVQDEAVVLKSSSVDSRSFEGAR